MFGGMILVYIVLVLLVVIGWVLNIIKMIALSKNKEGSPSSVSSLFVLRIVGIFVFPLGGILGFIKN